jgi:hypothetical protein
MLTVLPTRSISGNWAKAIEKLAKAKRTERKICFLIGDDFLVMVCRSMMFGDKPCSRFLLYARLGRAVFACRMLYAKKKKAVTAGRRKIFLQSGFCKRNCSFVKNTATQLVTL